MKALIQLGSLLLPLMLVATDTLAGDGNRLTYLDASEPYYVSESFPKLTTPQWVGEAGVDAVVIFAMDDLRGANHQSTNAANEQVYERATGPAIERLKAIDGRAHFSIMTCTVDPVSDVAARWIAEGVHLDIHTTDHPCPIFGLGLERARKTYESCVDLVDSVAGNHAVAFRTPCCDSQNSLSPRFFAEIFNSVTPKGNFLEIDSSVFHRFTADDPSLPRELVLNADGADRYARYVPFPLFANSVRNYPYPFVIGKLCWEFPGMTPSDWESHNIQGDANPRLLSDWEAQLDATVLKKGTFTIVIHPYGWSSPQQLADLIDYATQKYGKRIRFLNFKEARDRLNKNLLGGQSLRATNGQDNGVRLLDLNHDGYLDVVIGNEKLRQTRVWNPRTNAWIITDFPTQIVTADEKGNHADAGVKFGVLTTSGNASTIVHNDSTAAAWHFDGKSWAPDQKLAAALQHDEHPIFTSRQGVDQGVRLRDIEGKGRSEIIVSNPTQNAIFGVADDGSLAQLTFGLPAGTMIVDARGRDAGLRFVDIDEDGQDDVLFSNDDAYSMHLFHSMKDGWSRQTLAGKRVEGDQKAIPAIVHDGQNNGAWFLHRTLWVQNENTVKLPALVDRRTFNELLANSDTVARTPEQELHSISVRPGFKVELMASEPQVESPIAMAWGADGRLWVVEMGDYPLGIDKTGGPAGRVVILESTKNDGHYDKSTIFLDNLAFPTGVMPWGKGVLITMAPEIFYAEDSNRDGHCDIRKTLFKGFVEGNQQHRVNGLQWGLDNWIHGANGTSNGEITSFVDHFDPAHAVSISNRDFRIQPDLGIIEPETGTSQYGHSMDDQGNWYGCENSNPLFQFVLQDRYGRRNPHLAAPALALPVADAPGAATVFPISRVLQRFNEPGGAGHFTSANSAIIYRDDLFGPQFSNSSFVSEPVHDLVHREVLRREGYQTHSRRAEDEQTSEFFSAADNWSRPTTLRTGPDGALWIVDMYRQVIEHPEWIPKEWQERLDLRAGHTMGRIFRVFPNNVQPRPISRLDHLDTEALAAAMDSPSGWQRDTVQQLLVQRQDKAVVPALDKLARDSAHPFTRLQALCTLDGLGSLSPQLLVIAMRDKSPDVRQTAARLCEGRFKLSPTIGQELAKLAEDAEPQVRLQVACSLGEWDDAAAGSAIASMLLRDTGDPYITFAALSSVNKNNLGPLMSAVLKPQTGLPQPSDALMAQLLNMAGAMGDSNSTAVILSRISKPDDKGQFTTSQFSVTAALLDQLDASGTTLASLATQDKGGANADLKTAMGQLDALFASARATAADAKADEPRRAAATLLLARGIDHQAEDQLALAQLLKPSEPDSVQHAAIAALSHLKGDVVPQTILAGWKSYGPSLRNQALDVLLGRPQWAASVLSGIEKRQVMATDLNAPHRQRLLQSGDAAVRAKAAVVFAEIVKPDRQKVIDQYAQARALVGDIKHGGEVFSKTCTACHLLNGIGNQVGPDLSSVGDKSPEGLMIAILDPNRAVEPQYVNYIAETKSGDTISGVVGRETGSSVTLKIPGGQEQTVLRGDLKLFRSTGLSLMPEGLEAGMSVQDLADLISFIRASGPQPKPRTFDGNHPDVVLPKADGSIALLPSTAEIYGSKIVMETRYGNLGYWQAADDHAAWAFESPRAATYNVTIEYACDPSAEGNTLLLQVAGQQVTFRVENTGDWDTYRRRAIGAVKLPAGREHLIARPQDEQIRGALLDLRMIELTPVQ